MVNWIRKLFCWLLQRQTGAGCVGTVALVAARGSDTSVEPETVIRTTGTRARYHMRLVMRECVMPDMLMRTLHRLAWLDGKPEY